MYKIYLLILIFSLILYFLLNIKYENFYVHTPTTINIDNNLLKLYNISNQSNKIYDEMKDIISCTSDINCNNGLGKCISDGISNKCYKVINDVTVFECDSSKESHIKLVNVDSLNIRMKFSIILNKLNNQLIARSGLNVWVLYVYDDGKDSRFRIDTYNSNENIINSYIGTNILLLNTLYNIELITKTNENNKNENYIECIINNTVMSVKFFSEKRNIYDCISVEGDDNVCGPKPNECRKISKNYSKCIFSKNHEIIFGQPAFHLKKLTDLNYLDGYIGNFVFNFEDLYTNKCTFNVDENNNYDSKKFCLDSCKLNSSCNIDDCNIKCKDINVCSFDSTKTLSRHQVDCMSKCHTYDNCTSDYCKSQCEGCGENCYWIAQNYNKQDVKSFKPGSPYIMLSSTSYDGKKGTIRWKIPYEGKTEILGYILFLYKTYKKYEGMTIDKINTYNCNKYCEYVVSDLVNNESYTLGVRAYNSMGIGKLSNLITFKTFKKHVNIDILEDI